MSAKSLNVKSVAHAVVKKVRQGKLVKVGEIMKEQGYSDSYSEQPHRIMKQPEFQEVAQPLITGLAGEIARIKAAMARKNLDNEEYKVLVASLDVLTKNHQLLSGGATERRVFVIPSEVIGRNDIDTSQPLLENGSTKPSNDTA